MGRATTKRDGEEVIHGLHKVSNEAGQVKAELDGVDLSVADLGDADLSNLRWKGVKAAEKASLAGARNAPAEFLAWARSHGAIEAHDAEQAADPHTAAWALW